MCDGVLFETLESFPIALCILELIKQKSLVD